MTIDHAEALRLLATGPAPCFLAVDAEDWTDEYRAKLDQLIASGDPTAITGNGQPMNARIVHVDEEKRLVWFRPADADSAGVANELSRHLWGWLEDDRG